MSPTQAGRCSLPQEPSREGVGGVPTWTEQGRDEQWPLWFQSCETALDRASPHSETGPEGPSWREHPGALWQEEAGGIFSRGKAAWWGGGSVNSATSALPTPGPAPWTVPL